MADETMHLTEATTASGIHSIVRQHDWAADVKRYVPNAGDAAINGIIKHLGIALQVRTHRSWLATTRRSAIAFATAF